MEIKLTQILGSRTLVGLLAGTPAVPPGRGRTGSPATVGRVTVHSYYCSADIVATDATGRAFKRYQAVYSTRGTPPTIIYWRDLTSLGWPLDGQILADLRAGKPMVAGMGTASTNAVETGAQ